VATFVLVHGAWLGGWCWSTVVRSLQSLGHTVYAPSLTGLGERQHLLHAGIDLETHTSDIVNLLEFEDLHDVVLCGHSYGGMVITGVADRVGERLKSLIYLDAFVPADGQSMLDVTLPQRRKSLLARTGHDGCEWLVSPPPTPSEFKEHAGHARVDRLSRPQPLACFEQGARLSGRQAPLRRMFIVATDFDPSPFKPLAVLLGRHREWQVQSMQAGHLLMIDRPDDVATMLVEASA
jgi:pimeloyl-ACP methyl ester carboxylesterase